MKKPPLVLVTWVDACSECGWIDLEDFEERAVPVKVVTTGFLVKETKTYIVLVTSLAENGGMLDYTVIPRPWVKKVIKAKEL